MPLYKTIAIDDGIVGLWQITENPADLLTQFLPGELNEPELARFTFDKRKAEYLATRLLIKHLAGSEFTISYQQSGKPTITHSVYKHVAISHSREFACIILHKNSEVGIDIECIDRNFPAIAKRYLSEKELQDIDANQLKQCLYWSTKEAVFKLVPEDGIEFKEQIRISPFNPENTRHIDILYVTPEYQKPFQAEFRIFNNHCLVWVTG